MQDWTKERFQELFKEADVDITDTDSYVMCYPAEPLCVLIKPDPTDLRAVFFVSEEVGTHFNELEPWE